MTGAALVLALGDQHEPLDAGAVDALLDSTDLALWLVARDSDGQLVAWAHRLAAAHPGRCAVVTVAPATTKAESIRRGLLAALEAGAQIVGYASPDFSTPASEVARLLDLMRTRGSAVVMGTRVAMLGTDVRRNAARHYLGRVFAMLASVVLRVAIYDTQCAAKLFRRTPALLAALATPFSSEVVFDVELLGRLLVGGPGAPALSDRDIVEVPLKVWHGQGKPAVDPLPSLRALRDLRRIAANLRALRRA